MICLTADEVKARLLLPAFRISKAGYGNAAYITLDDAVVQAQNRLCCRPTVTPSRIIGLINAINQWLPTSSSRLLWVNAWSCFYPSLYAAFHAIRVSAGESRRIEDAAGHFFPDHNYGIDDQLEVSDKQSTDVALLIGLISIILMEEWIAILISEQRGDMVEFWEGNIIFSSASVNNIARARKIASEFNLVEGLR